MGVGGWATFKNVSVFHEAPQLACRLRMGFLWKPFFWGVLETLLSAEGCLIVRLALWGRWEWVDVLPFRSGRSLEG